MRDELISVKKVLMVAKAARDPRIIGGAPVQIKVDAPTYRTPSSSRIAAPNYDTVYINRLKEVINAPKFDVVDITVKGR